MDQAGRGRTGIQAAPPPDERHAAADNVEAMAGLTQELSELLANAVFVEDDVKAELQRKQNGDVEALKLHRRVVELEAELEAALAELAEQRARVAIEREAKESIQQEHDTALATINNSQTVFRMHYEELLSKTKQVEELESENRKLRSMVEVLSQQQAAPTAATGGGE